MNDLNQEAQSPKEVAVHSDGGWWAFFGWCALGLLCICVPVVGWVITGWIFISAYEKQEAEKLQVLKDIRDGRSDVK